ncbi:MAG: glycoside hydrolase family 78 protein [Defluviitaleaceae bacterium]|nr:glycoside hydrolase family 78 protein [Defluviitaleaceae bacterium]
MSLKVTNLKCNHLRNPLGYDLKDGPALSWIVEGGHAKKTKIEISQNQDFTDNIYEKEDDLDSLCHIPEINLKPRTRYYWRVTVNGASEVSWFETSKIDEPWQAKWISPATEPTRHPTFFKEFNSAKPVISARAYICGLGLYNLRINGQNATDEVLSPGLFAYDKWLQYQTYDITPMIRSGDNSIAVDMGNGWYKGRYGLHRDNFLYSDEFALICEVVITYEDGTQVIATDTSWKYQLSTVKDSNIFDGEYRDDTLNPGAAMDVKLSTATFPVLEARLNPPIAIMHELKPIEIIKTPAGETVLDLGQNMVGWLEFTNRAPKGSEIHLQFGEVLQGGNFYRDNLRGALCEFKYVSDGVEKKVRQQFTFYGFRYVKLTQWHQDVKAEDFTGLVIYSQLEQTGFIKTSNEKVNRLFENTLWGQRGNFLDVPTDCPQRDERMGWTGDAQAFFGTAAFNMDVAAFFTKYLHDLWMEQEAMGGTVPVVIPKHDVKQTGSCAWGDAATIIPWNHYIRYGDARILKRQYPSMKAWVDYIRSHDAKTGDTRLWKGDFHFCDWLALDVEDSIGNRFGGTDRTYLASCFYRYSSLLVTKAAKVLGYTQDEEFYGKLTEEVRSAIINEYVTPTGRLAVNTQTAYVLALIMDIIPEKWRHEAAHSLSLKLKESDYHLRTGFIGTSYLCRVLSGSGSNNIAYRLLLQEDFPSWLYQVNMGATTIWERWNSILPDGSISDTGMNSLNHYTYGSIMEWVYRDVAGIDPIEEYPGFRKFRLAPKPDPLLGSIEAEYHSVVGIIKSAWKYENGQIHYSFTVPYGSTAILTLEGEEKELQPGEYNFSFPVIEKGITMDTPIPDIYEYPNAQAELKKLPGMPSLNMLREMVGQRSLGDLCKEGFLSITDEEEKELFARIIGE